MVQSDADYADMEAVRVSVFVNELGIPREKEFDGNDHHSSHVLAYFEKDGVIIPVGTMRIRYFSGFAKFERMAVIKDYRKTDISDRIMNKGFDFVGRKGFTKVYGMCKKELLRRWKQCGYEEIPGAKRVVQNNMELVPIMKSLPEHPKVVGPTSYPDLLTAVEDGWDQVKIPGGIEEKVPDWLEASRKCKISAVILRMRKAGRTKG